MAASERHIAVPGKAEPSLQTKGLGRHREPPGSGQASFPVLGLPTTVLPTGRHSTISKQSPTIHQNALQEAHRESQSHLLAPVGKMAPVTPSPSRLVTRTNLPPSLQNGASRWGPRIGINHLSARRYLSRMSGSANQSDTGTLIPHFAQAIQALAARPDEANVTKRGRE